MSLRRWLGNDGSIIAVVFPSRIVRHRLEPYGIRGGQNMPISQTLEKVLRPTTQREADLVALKLFCLFSFILVGLIAAGIL